MASGSSTPNKLLVLDDNDEFDITSNVSNFRPSSSGSQFSSRPDSSSSRRTPTPTKQISLQAVKRKENRNDIIVEDIDFKDLNYSNKSGRKSSSVSDSSRLASQGEIFELTEANTETPNQHNRETNKKLEENGVTDSESEDDSSEEDDDKPKRKAPNELLLEFVSSVMSKDYEVANKLCQMILMFEPNNPEALTFRPLIQEKIQLDQIETDSEEADSAGDGEDDDDDDGDEDDEDESGDSDDDDSSDDSDDSDSGTDNDEEANDNNDDDEPREHRDSGIASASD